MDKEERKQLSDSLQMDSDLHITTSPPSPTNQKTKKKKNFLLFFFQFPLCFYRKITMAK